MMIYESSLSRSGSKKVSETVQVQPPAKRKGATGLEETEAIGTDAEIAEFISF